MQEITYDQYIAVMSSRPNVQPYTAKEWAKMSSQHKVLLGLTFRRELAAIK